MKDMIALESELVNRDIQITSLKDELSQTKASISAQSTRTLTLKVTLFYSSLGLTVEPLTESPFPSFWRLQGNLSSARSAHSEELSLLAGERDAATARLEGAEGEAEMLRERVRHADKENEVCERRGRGRYG